MNNTPPKQGVRARERNALERISGLEQDFQRLVQGVQQAMNQLESTQQTISEVLDAVVNITGTEPVQAKIAELRKKRASESAAKAKEALDLALVDGKIEQIEKVETGCILTGVEYDKDGNAIDPGYVQLNLDVVKPQFQEKMLGQGVGFKFETETGGQFEVTGIYKALPPEEPKIVTPPAGIVAPDGTPVASEGAAQ